jgi:hypothetical protein
MCPHKPASMVLADSREVTLYALRCRFRYAQGSAGYKRLAAWSEFAIVATPKPTVVLAMLAVDSWAWYFFTVYA